jgi:hypothetical protein
VSVRPGWNIRSPSPVEGHELKETPVMPHAHVKFRFLPASLVIVLALAMAAPALAGTQADPSEFFRRLESIGLSTDGLRKVASKIELFYKAPSGTAAASYGYILDNLYIPWEFKEKDSDRIRFDLAPNELNTLIHEFVHAANDVTCDGSAAVGSLAREHHDAVESIRADVMLDERNAAVFGLVRFPRFRADEVTGYFMGNCMMNLVFAVNDLVLYNTMMTNRYMTSVADVERFGDRLVLPPADTSDGFGQRLLKERFGKSKAETIAQFENKTVYWDDANRSWLKERMWKNLLGLNPPGDIRELLERLNASESEWMTQLRKDLVEARRKWAREEAARAARSPGREDPNQAAQELRGR